MTNDNKLALLASALIVPMAGQAQHAPARAGGSNPDRPNVILILADDLGYGDLGCYGAVGVETPAVNALAANGLRFTQCHAIASVSTPSRYSILTGQYAWRRNDTNVSNGDAAMIIKPEQFTLADAFRNQGYQTGAFGKWHLGLGDKAGQQDWNGTINQTPADIGFDYSYIMAATSDRVPCVFIENGRVANYDSTADPIQVNYNAKIPGEVAYGDTPDSMKNLISSHGHDQAIVNGIGRIGYMKGGGKALWKDENIADSITAHAVSFIEQHQAEPFFMYVATNDVHVPRWPHQRFRDKTTMGLRGAAIAQFDWTVGRIMEVVDSLGLGDNTLIMVTSDNGPVLDDGYVDQALELLGSHKPAGPFRGYKYSSFEGGTAVPLLVRWPARVRGGQTSGALVSQVDLVSSLSSLIGAEVPETAAPDSRNSLATILGTDTVGRDYVMEMSNTRVLSVRTKRWKFITPNDGAKLISWITGDAKVETGNLATPQLYDMEQSLYESVNVAAEHPDVVNEMRRILEKETGHKWYFATNAPTSGTYYLIQTGKDASSPLYMCLGDADGFSDGGHLLSQNAKESMRNREIFKLTQNADSTWTITSAGDDGADEAYTVYFGADNRLHAAKEVPADAQRASFNIAPSTFDAGWAGIQLLEDADGTSNSWVNMLGGRSVGKQYGPWKLNDAGSTIHFVPVEGVEFAVDPTWVYKNFANFNAGDNATRLMIRNNVTTTSKWLSNRVKQTVAETAVYLTACPDTAMLWSASAAPAAVQVTNGNGMVVRAIDLDTENIDQLRRQIWHLAGWDPENHNLALVNECGQRMVMADVAAAEGITPALTGGAKALTSTFQAYPFDNMPDGAQTTFVVTPNRGTKAVTEVYNLGVAEGFANAWGGVKIGGYYGAYNSRTDNNNGLVFTPITTLLDAATIAAIDDANAADPAYRNYLEWYANGIRAISNGSAGSRAASRQGVFTIDGRRLSNAHGLPHGVYIINGRKTVK